MTDRPSAPQPVADLVQRLRERGDALRCHPVANGSIDRIEAAGELLVEAAAALDAAVAAARAEERERCAIQLDALGCDHCAAAIRAATPQEPT